MDLKTLKQIKNGVYSFLPGKWLGDEDNIDFGALSGMYQKQEQKNTNQGIVLNPITQNDAPAVQEKPMTVSGITDLSGTWTPSKTSNPAMGIAGKAFPWVQLGLWGAGGFLNGLNSTTSSDQLLQDAGKSNNSFGGISYTSQRSVNKNEVMDQYDKKTVNSIFTNPFETVGRLINRDNQKEAIREAEKKRLRENNFNRSSAASKYMQLREAQGYSLGKEPVETSSGFEYGIEPNARGDYGEIIKNMTTGAEHKIKVGKGKTDGALINVKPTDVILSKKTGAADYYENTGDINGAIAMNKTMRQLIESGKLPGFKFGYLPNLILHGIEGLTALGDYLDIKNQPVKRVNTYAGNTYEGLGLRGLAGLHYSKIPVLNQLSNMRAASDYTLRNSGASSAQQYWGSVANTANMYKAIADLNTNLQEKNIGLKGNYYTQALNVGAQNAQRRQPATQYDEEFFAKGRGAKTKMEYQRLSDIFNIGQSALANDAKLRMYNNMLANYQQDGEIPAGLFNPSDAYYKYRRFV